MRVFNREFDAALFDMDGLLLDTERISMRAWQAACSAHGLTLTDAGFLEIIGHREADCLRILRGMLGDHIDTDGIRRANRADYARRLAAGVPVMPGVVETLERLGAAGTPMAVATSTHRAVALEKLTKAGLARHFRAVVGGDMVDNGKPAPDLYLRAAELLGVAPGKCLALEDSGPGLRAAHAAGCAPVLIPDMKSPTPEIRSIAFRILNSMTEMNEELKRN